MIKFTFIFTILILLIGVSKGDHDNIVSSLVDEIQEQINITCLCTKDEKCDLNSGTCRLNHSDQACYESWTKELSDNTIHVTAGYNKIIFHYLFY